jgi:hypothetical protein
MLVNRLAGPVDVETVTVAAELDTLVEPPVTVTV